MNTDFRIRAGTYNSADLASSVYAVKNFAKQTDQGLIIPWTLEATPPEPLIKNRAISRKVVPDGDRRWTWTFSLMTFDMFDYWKTTYFTSGLESGDVTVKTFDVGNDAIYLNATISELSRGKQNALGYSDVVWEFIGELTAS